MVINPIVDELRKGGHRMTPQRLAILQVLEDSRGHLSPAEIYTLASERVPGMTETTVYRTLDFLARHGLVLVAHIGGGKLVYETAGSDHHHLICRYCGTSINIDHEELEPLYQKFQKENGFLVDCSHVTFFGVCAGCQNEASQKESTL